MIRGEDGLRAVRTHLCMTTVMQQDHVSATNLHCDLLFDDAGRWRIPVVASHVPHDRFEPQFAGGEQGNISPSSERRTEDIAMFADRVVRTGVACQQILADARVTLEDRQAVSASMS